MLVLMCEAAGHRFALDARQVVEVVAHVRTEPVVHAPEWLAGVCVYGGGVTPIVDLTYLAAAKPCPRRWASRILLVPITGEPTAPLCGLVVEKVAVTQLVTSATPERPLGMAP